MTARALSSPPTAGRGTTARSSRPTAGRGTTAPSRRASEQLLVQRQHRNDDVERDERDALESRRLAVARDLREREPGQQQRADVDGSERERELGLEQQRDEHERREQERGDLRDGVLDHRDRQIGLA